MARSRLDKLRDRLNISRLAIQRSWLTVCCWIAIAIAGFFAFSSIKYALFPDITFPVVIVNATVAQSPSVNTALDSEAALTNPLEQQLQTLDGLAEMLSTTTPGRSVITLKFDVNTALAASTTAAEQAIDNAGLPEAAATEVIPLNLNEAAAVSYALSSAQLDLDALAEVARRDILPSLQALNGVLRVDLQGAGIDAEATTDQGANFGADLRNPPTLVRFGGEDALAVQVVKQGSANTLEVVDRVEAAIEQLQAQLPAIQFVQAITQADYIRAATQATIDSLLGAIAIAVLVIFVFLRSWRATLITALAIPLSLLGTCIVMAIYGFNFETITLLALAIVIGIIVDDAIVEIENIARHIELGATPRQAALRATQEIGLTVSASTLTIVAVFLPVAFMGGTVGQLFQPFGLTVSAALLTSMLVARNLSPVLAAYWMAPKSQPQPALAAEHGSPLGATVPTTWLERHYHRLLAWSLCHRWAVVGAAIASFIAGILIIPLIPQGFIPQLDRGEFYLNYTVELPQISAQSPASNPALPADPTQGSPAAAADTDRQAAPRGQILQLALAEADQLEETVLQLPEVASVLTTVGGRGQPNQGSLYIKLEGKRDRDTAAVQAQLRQDLPNLEAVETSVEDVQFVDTGGERPLQVALLG
ncbi:MAG: efflux RND transporter permease subunit, partial [Cyanobacteria bacterium P01_D01_bin.128]